MGTSRGGTCLGANSDSDSNRAEFRLRDEVTLRSFLPRVALWILALGMSLGVPSGSLARSGFLGAAAHIAPLHGVLFAGCSAVWTGPGCDAGALASLRIWVPLNAGQSLAVYHDGVRMAPSSLEAIHGGALARLSINQSKPESTLSLVTRDATQLGLWSLRLRREPLTPPLVALARQHMDAGQLDEALRNIESWSNQALSSDKGTYFGLRARIDIRRHKPQEAIEWMTLAVEHHLRAGAASSALWDGTALIYLLTAQHRLLEAREWVSRLAEVASLDSENRARLLYHEHLIHLYLGRLRLSLDKLREATEIAERLQMDADLDSFRELLGSLLVDMAQNDEALAAFRRLLPRAQSLSACDRVRLFANAAFSFVTLRRKGMGLDAMEDPEALLDQAIALLDSTCRFYPNPHMKALLLTELARVRLDRGDIQGGESLVERAEKASLDPTEWLRLRWMLLRGMASSLRAQWQVSLEHFAMAELLARAIGFSPGQQEAKVGQAKAYAAMGNLEAASNQLDSAARLVQRASLEVPLGEGRGAFLYDESTVDQLRVGLLIDSGRYHDAFEAVREARTRLLATLPLANRLDRMAPARAKEWDGVLTAYRRERDSLEKEASADWGLSKEELMTKLGARARRSAELRKRLDDVLLLSSTASSRLAPAMPPDAEEVVLAYYPVGNKWLGFAWSRENLRYMAIGTIPAQASPSHWAEHLLGPFAPEIARAKGIRFWTYGAIDDIDFASLPWHSGLLGETKMVRYGLGVGASKRAADTGLRTALVVADTLLDLRQSRSESEDVRASLHRAGFEVNVLEGRSATRHAVMAALAQASWLHFSGHGAFRGRDGWDSSMVLADRGTISAADVLALPQSPTHVLLMGCEMGRMNEHAGLPGPGIAQSFLLAGSRDVIAARRTVSDAFSARLATNIHQAMALNPGQGLEGAWQRTWHALRHDPEMGLFRYCVRD